MFRRNLLLGLLLVGAAPAQVTTATLFGVVTDSSGAGIPGAQVTFRHLETGGVSTKTTDTAGEFQFDFLRVGSIH